jgi:hypothetical protein
LAKSPKNDYIKYSGIGIQLLVVVFLVTYAGFWLDRYFQTAKPIFSILFGILSVVLGIWFMVKELLSKK